MTVSQSETNPSSQTLAVARKMALARSPAHMVDAQRFGAHAGAELAEALLGEFDKRYFKGAASAASD